MSTRFLLDANVLSEPTKPRPHPRVLAALEANADRLATCSVVWHEMLFGAAKLPASQRRRNIEAYLQDVNALLPIFPHDAKAAEWHATERARLQKQNYTPPFFDGQIAAIAHVNGLTVVSANTKDFRRFRKLKLQNWQR